MAPDELQTPQSEEQAVSQAAILLFHAALLLIKAGNLALDEAAVPFYAVHAKIIRDLATKLSPNQPDWPKGGAVIYDITTRRRAT